MNTYVEQFLRVFLLRITISLFMSKQMKAKSSLFIINLDKIVAHKESCNYKATVLLLWVVASDSDVMQ